MNKNECPNLFLVGAPKAGTTSIYNYLIQHPDIFCSLIKESHFFSSDIDINLFRNNYKYEKIKNMRDFIEKGNNLHVTFLRNESDYKELYKNAKQKNRLDASSSYLYSTDAAKNIHSVNPHSKIIMILRSPVHRAYSHYIMDKKNGWAKNDFISELNSDYNKSNKGWGISNLYVELGLYSDQIKRYQKLFPASQILILFYDDLVYDSQNMLNEIFSFLSIDSIKINTQQKFNKASLPNNEIINTINRNKVVKRYIKNILPEVLVNFLKKKSFTENIQKINREEFKSSVPYFKNDIETLSQIINKDLKHWLNY